MNVFAAALNEIFEDPNMAFDGWHRDGEGNFTSVRVMLKNPDDVGAFNDGRFVTDACFIDVRVSEVQKLSQGDTILIGDDTYEIRSEPRRDSQRMIWRCEARLR